MIAHYKNAVIAIPDPNTCPHCHVTNTPHENWHILSKDTNDDPVFLSAWTCSNQECQKVFIVQHRKESGQFQISRFLNGFPKGPMFPKPILDLRNGGTDQDGSEASRFINTYLQSLSAENSGLFELAGMGYRKAIEYLVKDWAIQNVPDDKDTIQRLWLGQVISSYFEGDLKDILERATWLGNDQAHYNKVFEEYNISHLKELIELVMVELDRQYKMRHYIDTIQSRKGK